ncbi:MAG: hypothetical protein ACKVP0_26405 [Pirellulaceae bacterium]
MAKRLITAYLSVALITSAFLTGLFAADQNQGVLAKIDGSLAQLRRTSGVVRYKLAKTVRLTKGSLNSSYPSKDGSAGPNVPSRDLTASAVREYVFDFPNKRHWSKGTDCQLRVDKNRQGVDDGFYCQLISEAAFDGVELTSLEPKETMDARSIPAGTTVPVEYTRIKPSNLGEVTRDENLYPVFFREGALPASDQPITLGDCLPGFAPEKWRVSGISANDSSGAVVIQSSPDRLGQHYEYTLQSGLHYAPTRWVRNYKGKPALVVDISYTRLVGSPRLKGWQVHYYDDLGGLTTAESYEVLDFQEGFSVTADKFRVPPSDGMIVHEVTSAGSSFFVAGNESIRSATGVEFQVPSTNLGTWLKPAMWAIMMLVVIAALVLFTMRKRLSIIVRSFSLR